MTSEQLNPNQAPSEIGNGSTTRAPYSIISNEKRQNLMGLVYEQGQTIKEAADVLQLNYSSARTIITNYAKNNVINLLSKGGSARTILTPDVMARIENTITFNPKFTLKEIKQNIESTSAENFGISISTLNRYLRELQKTLKLSHRELDRLNTPD